ncbi:MAG: nitrate reductase molybdenum cofactor assembly chaperone [Gammaproteobacteria bacterium]|nr:nitrate reductase molybdenum cofactor assembly chaperone [Gammaproteobacteria bacterium]MCG3144699.1 hypothetical protein [Gammaproteobacteria bacterium]
MSFHRIASALLGYPDAALRAALPAIAGAIEREEGLAAGEREVLARFVERLSAADSLSAEEDYVRTFDMVPEHSLHLTHHLIGEDKNRGPALIDLTEHFREHGLEIIDKELPDYLPLLLEFVSLLEEEAGRSFLSRWRKVLRQLRANLAEAGSLYADLVGLIEARGGGLGAGGDMSAPRPAQRTDPCLADGDFDPPVSWSAPSACGAPRAPGVVPVRLHGRATAFVEGHAPSTQGNDVLARR